MRQSYSCHLPPSRQVENEDGKRMHANEPTAKHMRLKQVSTQKNWFFALSLSQLKFHIASSIDCTGLGFVRASVRPCDCGLDKATCLFSPPLLDTGSAVP